MNFSGTDWARKKGVEVDIYNRKMFLMKRKMKNKVVLDAGSGFGTKADFFADTAKEIYGLEISEEDTNIAIKKNTHKNVQYLVGNVENMPYQDSFFDVVYSYWVIEHLENPSVFLEECLRILKPKGILML